MTSAPDALAEGFSGHHQVHRATSALSWAGVFTGYFDAFLNANTACRLARRRRRRAGAGGGHCILISARFKENGRCRHGRGPSHEDLFERRDCALERWDGVVACRLGYLRGLSSNRLDRLRFIDARGSRTG
jgi:hypothetical protein